MMSDPQGEEKVSLPAPCPYCGHFMLTFAYAEKVELKNFADWPPPKIDFTILCRCGSCGFEMEVVKDD